MPKKQKAYFLNTMVCHSYSTYLWKAERTDDINSIVTEAEILLSLLCVAEESINIQADPEAYVEVQMVRESIAFKYNDLTIYTTYLW